MKKMNLENKAKIIRRTALEMIYRAETSHIGTCFSCVDILVALYFGVLKVNPKKPNWENRDRFILSKGHGCAALYATLAEKKFFGKSHLDKYSLDGSTLAGHATREVLPAVETSTGSEGHGLPIGIGMALALRAKFKMNKVPRIFVLMGDGECNEGSIWEAAMFAGFHKLNNLVAIVDKNGLQIMGKTSEIINLEPLEQKFKDFGWQAVRVNGHDISKLQQVLKTRHEKPLAVIAETIKGKGVSFMEDKKEWHGKYPNEEEYRQAVKELS